MSNGFKISASKFRFQGTQFSSFLRIQIRLINDAALAEMLRYLANPNNTPVFTGESLATFRQFRDYLAKQGFEVTLEDATPPRILQNQYKFPKSWNTPLKIANLENAGHVSANGQVTVFNIQINDRIGGAGGGSAAFSIHVDFTSGSQAFLDNEAMQGVFEDSKAVYKKAFQDGLKTLFDPSDFKRKLASFFNRVDIRGE